MDIDDFFNIKEEKYEPTNMSKDEFVDKTRKLLKHLDRHYTENWRSRPLKEEEFPNENICDKCTGCGIFKLKNEEAECTKDYEEGECYHRYFDAEEFGLEVETCFDDIYELLFVDNVE
jgi:23S rRNA A2030 N6-methylase RlmJ